MNFTLFLVILLFLVTFYTIFSKFSINLPNKKISIEGDRQTLKPIKNEKKKWKTNATSKRNEKTRRKRAVQIKSAIIFKECTSESEVVR